MISLHDFHFLRPAWFLALLPLVVLLVLLWRRNHTSRSWQAVVDPQLLPHLLIGSSQQRHPWWIALSGIAALLAITALAGPVWNKQQQPVFRHNSSLVVLLDLSQSMNATDVPPSRLQMAKFKLRDLLAQRKEGETALVVYAAVPFTVTPLTNDIDNIRRQLSSLTPELMPAQGSRADRAIAQAQTLLQQGGASHGNVLLITDGIENTPSAALHQALSKLLDAGYQLSVLGVGNADGAPIPVQGGGFLKDADGAIVVAKYHEKSLAQLAAQGHGIYRHLSAKSDNDTDALTAAFASGQNLHQGKKVAGMKSQQWREQGPWLLLPLLPLVALAFRRGYLLLLFFVLLTPVPRSAYALGWNDLWQRPDQQAAKALARQQPKQAAKLFHDPQWRAAAHYRAGDYQSALADLKGQQGAEAEYNRGNALAQLGKFPEALSAYDHALKEDPHLEDAKHNSNLVKKWLQQQQSKQPQNNQNGKDQSQSKSKDKTQQGDKTSPSGKTDHDKSTSNKTKDASAANQQQKQNTDSKKDETKSQHTSSAPADKAHKDNKAQTAQNKSQQAASDSDNKSTAQKTPPASEASAESKPTVQDEPQDGAPSALQADTTDKPQKTQATEQWLRRILDDPGGLWRRKFLYQYKHAYQSQQGESKPW